MIFAKKSDHIPVYLLGNEDIKDGFMTESIRHYCTPIYGVI